MKVSSVGVLSAYKKAENKLSNKPVNENKVYKQNNNISNLCLGLDVVSFKSSDFNKTLRENYFKLKPGCKPDEFQIDAGKAINEGKDVLVEAPTGTGKTAIAHYAVSNNMKNGKTTFYTTPLKALSNQKLNEFREIYGEENVGILTGDRRENPEAPVVIMTTEVYRNMALSNMNGEKNPLMENLGTVIFDEFHYLGDKDRGPVWEESLMYTPKGVKTLELSATIGNPEELKNWISELDDNNVKLISIPESKRHVPLKFDVLPTTAYKAEEKRIQNSIKRTGTAQNSTFASNVKPTLSDYKYAVDVLNKKEQLPAIFFVFSKKFSSELSDYLGTEGPDLTTKDEKKEIDKIINKYSEKGYIGSNLNKDAIKKGYAIHNAGIMPQQKEMVEELFQKKLVKAVIATETLAAGINMPAKTVVISSAYKPTDDDESVDGVRLLSANEFKQMSGRAGRRGIDKIGYVYTMPTTSEIEQEFIIMEVSESNSIKSQFNPDYGFLSGYYKNNEDNKNLKEIYNKSFYAYDSDKNVKSKNVENLINVSENKKNVLMERGFLEKEGGKVKSTMLGEMASKVKGYDALMLAETIAEGKYKGISPESLAMVAGAIANPAINKELNIQPGEDYYYTVDGAINTVETVKSELNNSIRSMLSKFGKSIADFYSMEEMLKFAESVEKSDTETAVLREDLDNLADIKNKLKTIKSESEKYTLEELVKSMKNDRVISSKVLHSYLEKLEDYKKYNNIEDFDSYISKLEAEIQKQDTSTKGNKAKNRVSKIIAEMQEEVDEAVAMKYLDEHLVDKIATNFQFTKKNKEEEINNLYYNAQEKYAKNTMREKLISAIKGVMSIENYELNHDLNFESMQNSSKISEVINSSLDKVIDIFNTEAKNGIENTPIKLGKNTAVMLYKWAMLNKMNTDSMTNWKQLLRSSECCDTDEGTIYRKIMQTADLLSQISEIANAGKEYAKTEEEIKYYNDLSNTACSARKLLIKEPVTV